MINSHQRRSKKNKLFKMKS